MTERQTMPRGDRNFSVESEPEGKRYAPLPKFDLLESQEAGGTCLGCSVH